jgi:uncharacterized protein (DUF1778 family)
MSDRRPLAAMQSREPHSIRFKPVEWAMFQAAAAILGLEVTRYVRECALTGHSFEQARRERLGHTRVTA